MQWALPEVRPIYDVRFFRMIAAVAGCLHPSYVATRLSRVNIMIRASRLALELPQILEPMKVGHCLGVPLLSFLG
jgi:hypothetical protein